MGRSLMESDRKGSFDVNWAEKKWKSSFNHKIYEKHFSHLMKLNFALLEGRNQTRQFQHPYSMIMM